MERTWKPTAAGILCIIAGSLSLVFLILSTLYLWVADFIFIWGANPGQESGVDAFLAGWWRVGIIAFILAIVGGIYALRRRKWGLALAGSIAVIVFGGYGILAPLVPGVLFIGLGILAIIFISLGKREFKSGTRVAES